MPHRVGVREAKAKLSSLIAEVRRGEAVTITDRGQPVARLVPVGDDRTSLEARLGELEAMGWVGKEPTEEGVLPKPVRLKERGLAQRYLREDRDAG